MLTEQWYSGSTDGAWYDLSNTLHLADADPDSEHTVLHETGHFFQQRLYNGNFPAVTNCISLLWARRVLCGEQRDVDAPQQQE